MRTTYMGRVRQLNAALFIGILFLVLVFCIPAFAKVWTYESNNALNVVWDSDSSDSYRVLITDLETLTNSTVRTFDTMAKVEGLVNHRIYRITVYGDTVTPLGEKYICYNVQSNAVTIDQTQLNVAVSAAMPPERVSAARVIVGVTGYWGYVELANTTNKIQNITVWVGKYSVPVILQPGAAWATLAERICPDEGQWAAWVDDLPDGVVFNAGWHHD